MAWYHVGLRTALRRLLGEKPHPLGTDIAWLERFRDIFSDPLNLLIERVPNAGLVTDGNVTLHTGLITPFMGPNSYYDVFSEILLMNRGVHEPLEEYIFQEMLRTLPRTQV